MFILLELSQFYWFLLFFLRRQMLIKKWQRDTGFMWLLRWLRGKVDTWRFFFIVNTVILSDFGFRTGQRSPKRIRRRNVWNTICSVALFGFRFWFSKFFEIQCLKQLRRVVKIMKDSTKNSLWVIEKLTLICLDKIVCAMEFWALGLGCGSECATQALIMSHKTWNCSQRKRYKT